MEYEVWGEIKFNVSIEIDADSEEDALKKGKELLYDYYRMNSNGAYHNPEKVKTDLDVAI